MDYSNSSGFPATFEEFCYLIEHRCGTSLSSDYCAQRVKALSDDSNHTTLEFTRIYGEGHRRQVISWYEKAGKNALQ